MDFSKRYDKLNDNQKLAVDTIDGPVMVIAGPGTGKTELLSVRVANILKNTDTLPENILCLTFTDSGASTMLARLSEIIGRDAYKVAVHTFHSFGAEVINQNAEYFYLGANYQTADELSKYEILQEIFEKLPFSNPLSTKNNGEYTHLRDCFTVISEFKKSGFLPDEIINILDNNDLAIEKIEKIIAPILDGRMSPKTIPALAAVTPRLTEIDIPTGFDSVQQLSQIISDELNSALVQADNVKSTTPVTAWKNRWFKKDEKNQIILKSREKQIKLRATVDIYKKYLEKMSESKMFDFDDMIMEVVHKIEKHDDLRYNLQEKYQYILVDEFQDTNIAQMRILHSLTDNDINEGRPNLMVVGDDDQAIYSFQGADVSNIIDFRTHFPDSKVITLNENYRSTENILNHARDLIVQGQNRLENSYSDINKKLNANKPDLASGVKLFETKTISEERYFIADNIKNLIESGIKPSDITVLTRRHSEIYDLLPYLYKKGIAVNYERHDNILQQPIIIFIEQVSNLLIDIAQGRLYDANAALPEVLAHQSWGISPYDIWKLSLLSHNNHKSWLENMENYPAFQSIHSWIIESSGRVLETPLEQMLDIIIGTPENKNDEFCSPIYGYYFSESNLNNNPDLYLTYLDSVRTLRSRLREYKPNDTPTLKSFVDFISKNRQINATINSNRNASTNDSAINVMTAHKSKGLEFNHVYIINAVDNNWGESARSRSRMIGYPENLQIAPAGETEDERLRLFYVATTRAKNNLTISYSLENDFGKNTLRTAFLADGHWSIEKVNLKDGYKIETEIYETDWYQNLTEPITISMRDLLAATLENYKLSVTHLHNFLDVTRGGPQNFLVQNLLKFPQAKSPSAAFGTAIHNTMQQAHSSFLLSQKTLSINKVIDIYTDELKNQYLPVNDFEKYLDKGISALKKFFEQNPDFFKSSQKTELSFANQNSLIDNAHLNGKLDLVEIDKKTKTIVVTDYKTGSPLKKWGSGTDYEKIKSHKYEQQLMFYKLMIENSRDYGNYDVISGNLQFIEPTKSGDIISLESDFSSEELEEFKLLINAVWDKITKLDLPDTSKYEKNLKGILQFEQDLINL